jgi:hypothetical protein
MQYLIRQTSIPEFYVLEVETDAELNTHLLGGQRSTVTRLDDLQIIDDKPLRSFSSRKQGLLFTLLYSQGSVKDCIVLDQLTYYSYAQKQACLFKDLNFKTVAIKLRS